MTSVTRLPLEALYQRCDTTQFDFQTTAELEALPEIIGQPRAVEAVQFSVGIQQRGFNVYVLGPAGTGRHSLVRRYFEQRAATGAAPLEWCYVNNFRQPHKPRVLGVPAGKGVELRKDMEQLVVGLQQALSSAFESEEYQTQRQDIAEEYQQQQEHAFEKVQQQAKASGLTMLRTPAGLVFAPMRNGEVLSMQEIQNLSEEERTRLEGEVEKLQNELQKILRQLPRTQRQLGEQLHELNRKIAEIAISGLLDELHERYQALPEVVDYIDAVKQDVIENVQDFLAHGEERPQPQQSEDSQSAPQAQGDPPNLRRYRVNVLVDRSDGNGAPVIYEDNPTYQNLIGRVEYVAQMGVLLTDFNLIKPGALHQANGGYLILDAQRVLANPFSWEALKRVLRSGQLRIESLGQLYSLISTVSLEPEPIPLNVKVALVGEPLLYYLLCAYDPEFSELFKVAADFSDQMAWNVENQVLYARLIGSIVCQQELSPLDRAAVARVIEYSARLVGDSERLSTNLEELKDLLAEANYWAGISGVDTIGAAEVQKAIEARIRRSDRVREHMQEAILRHTILIDTTGEKVGQINGLAYLQLGSFAFGQPNRITVQVKLGRGEVIDIEREVKLGGPIHSKGVLILVSFLGARYGADRPLSLSASLVFEQSYGGIEGDSASSTELYALLSAIANAPIKQSLAVTGSVDQFGQVQAIGGVNEKIEGFFDICQARGLSGEQGVLIPSANRKHLMLRQDVREAVAAGKFHIYAIDTIDQGIELLTGLPAGERNEAGEYPKESINGRVEKRLAEFARKWKEFNAGEKGGNSQAEGKESAKDAEPPLSSRKGNVDYE